MSKTPRLYTTLTRLKAELSEGRPIAMTPVPRGTPLIDPALVDGHGALHEDARRGLRCPVTGCGEFHHNLEAHWRIVHQRRSGRLSALRAALSLHPKARLLSTVAREKRSASARRTRKSGHRPPSQRGRVTQRHTGSVGYRNLRNTCDAQLAQRFAILRDKVGRDPVLQDVRALDPGLGKAAVAYFGSWNAFKATVSDRIHRRGMSKLDVEDAFYEWFRVHGRMPTLTEAEGECLPLLPSPDRVVRVLGVNSWDTAVAHLSWLFGNSSSERGEAIG